MNSNNKVARIVGVLFITVMVTWFIGYMLIDPLLTAPDYLQTVYAHETRIMIGVLFELIEVAGVVGIIVMMFPILKKGHESLALGYAGFRILEVTMLIIGALAALFQITISQEYGAVGAVGASSLETLGTLFLAARVEWSSLILGIFYGLSALIFFYLLHQSQLLPRFIPVVGLIGAGLVLTSSALKFFGFDQLMIFGLPMGLIEIFLGIWLIVKGFNTPAVDLPTDLHSSFNYSQQ